MILTADDPRAAYFDVFLWDGSKWTLQDRCLEAEDGVTGYVRVEVEQRNGKVLPAKYIGSVKFVRKRIEKSTNPIGWGKKLLAPDEEMP